MLIQCLHIFNDDAHNVRNQANIGGVLDIGCYCISLSRFIFESEPIRVQSFVEYDPKFGTDRLASGIMEFENGIANFLCSTQLEYRQGAIIYGTQGYIKLSTPFSGSKELERRITINRSSDIETIIMDPFDQYTLQGDAFSKTII